jgi:hypothetical protein
MHDPSAHNLLPNFPSVQQLTIYDLRGISRDRQLAATIIAGIINRAQPSVYLIIHDDDVFWLQQVPSSIPRKAILGKGQEAFQALLTASVSQVRGVIIYDPVMPDSINVATTLAGQQDGVVVSPELADEFQCLYQWPILSDLRNYHWQSRVQAYHWAQQQLSTASTAIIAGLDPHAFCALRSFLVATRAFVYWLDTRKYLPERSGPGLSERSLLKKLLSSLAPQAIHLGWVVHEQSAVALCSRYGIPVIASDYTANLEVWGAIPAASAPPVIEPVPAPAPEPHIFPDSVSSSLLASHPDKNTIYVSFTMSDGDNLQYCQHRLRTIWQDSARGSVPIGWTLSPLLLQAMPALAEYYTYTATANDELICGPSGMGYMYPSQWPRAQRMRYFQQTGALMQQLGMTTIEMFDVAPLYSTGLPLLATFSLTGMGMIDSYVQRECVAVLRDYGVRGVLSGVGYTGCPTSVKCVDGVIIYQNPGFTSTVEQTVALIKMATRLLRRRPLFLNVYLIAWTMTPTLVQQVMDELFPVSSNGSKKEPKLRSVSPSSSMSNTTINSSHMSSDFAPESAYTFVLPRTLLALQNPHERADSSRLC